MRVKPARTRGDGTVFAKQETAEDGAKVFKLEAAPYTWNVGPGVKKQDIAAQVGRKRSEGVELKDIRPGQGLG